MPAVGDRLAGRYEIRDVITERPTGKLLRGFDTQIGVEVALRLINEVLLADEEERQQFVQRANRARTLQHANLIRLYDVLIDDRAVFLVMQWAPGQRLDARLQEPITLAEARLMIRRIASGIAYAHQHGVVVGNVRADTVLLYPDGLKLTNVGVGPALPRARFLKAIEDKGGSASLAPEVLAGGAPDERSDVFGLAYLAKALFEHCELNRFAAAFLDRVLTAKDRPRDAEAFVRELESMIDRRNERPSSPSIPTGNDTERVEKLPPLPTRAEVEPVLESRHAVTSPQGRASRDIELAPEDLVEAVIGAEAGEGQTRPLPRLEQAAPAKEVTDVGYRSPVREDVDELIAKPVIVEMPAPAQPSARVPSRAKPIPQVPDDESDATRRVVKMDFDVGPLPEGLAPPPAIAESLPLVPESFVERERSTRVHVFAILALAGLTLGAFGAVFMWGLSARQTASSQPIVITMPAAPTTPVVTPVVTTPVVTTPVATPPVATPPVATPPVATPPVATPEPSPPVKSEPVATTPSQCALGMAPLSSAHPFCIDLYEYPGGHTIPRTQVSLTDAAQVCTSRGLRLCSDAEWEQACRGSNNASYPYGQAYDALRCNTGSHAGVIQPTGTMTRCRSAAGAYDMSGNVAEWTASGSQRGGSATGNVQNARCSHVVKGASPDGAVDVGFRCCGDLARSSSR